MQIHSPSTQQPVSEVDRLGDEIAELSAQLDAATARLLDLIREFDTRGGWNTGFRSCAAWLSWRVGLDLGAARERVRVARALGTLPLLAEALGRGELSYAKVRALTRVATPETPTPAQQRADALALLAETALHQGLDPGVPGERYQVVVHVDAQVLADPGQPGQSVLEGGTRVPRKRPGASRATPAGWSCATTTRAACWRSGPGPGRFLPLYAVPSTSGTRATASRGAMDASPRGIISATGPTAAPPRSRTSHSSAAGITGRCTRRATRSRGYPTAPSSSGDRTATRCLRCRRLRRCPLIPSRLSARITTRGACMSPRGRGVRAGSGSD